MSAAGSVLASGARTAYELMFEVSPIIFSGGYAGATLGGLLPVLSFLGSFAGVDGLPEVRFVPLPGATVIANAIGAYPFANQVVAANAIIKQPKTVSLLMISPVNSDGGYLTKLAGFLALQNSFEAHMAAGGTFHVMTPSYPYMDCIMTNMQDVTSGAGSQQQIQWQIDFVQPLITQAAANSALNGLMSKISGGQQILSETWSNVQNAAGAAAQGVIGVQAFPVNLTGSVTSSPLPAL